MHIFLGLGKLFSPHLIFLRIFQTLKALWYANCHSFIFSINTNLQRLQPLTTFFHNVQHNKQIGSRQSDISQKIKLGLVNVTFRIVVRVFTKKFILSQIRYRRIC